MARKHVINYFLQVENQYLEMLDNVKDFKELLDSNKVSEDEYNDFMKEVEVLKTNYERLSYIIFLLNKPNKDDKKEILQNKQWYDALKTSSKEALLDESKDALSTLKELIKKGNKDEKNN